MDESTDNQNRRTRRSSVLLSASIEIDGIPVPATLRNLSEQGALVEGDRLPPEGSSTNFGRNELCLKSDIVWVQGRYAGLRFERPLRRDELLRNVPAPRQRLETQFRRPGLACRPLTPYEREMLEVWMRAAPTGRAGE
jgi:hypothetical protein